METCQDTELVERFGVLPLLQLTYFMVKADGVEMRLYCFLFCATKCVYSTPKCVSNFALQPGVRLFLEIVNDVNSKEKLCTEPSSFTSLFNKLYSKEIH